MSASIRLSDPVYRRIENVLHLVLRTVGERQPDGTWSVPVTDWVWDELQREKRSGESDEDTLVRLIEDTARELLRRKRMN
jgi:hypothetical protein